MGDNCPRCSKAVYFAEEAKALGRKWHKQCLTCVDCNKRLDSFSINDREGEIYCRACFSKYHQANIHQPASEQSYRRRSSDTSQFGGSSNACPRCHKPVYFAEEVIANGKKYHKLCMMCGNCRKMLDSTTLTEHEDEVYCRACHTKLFGPTGYGFSGGAAGLSTESGKRNSTSDIGRAYAQAQVPADKTDGGPGCPRCGKAVYFAERELAGGKTWHKACLKCNNCSKKLDSTTLTEHDDEIFCRSCYGKKYGPKGYGFAAGGAGLSMDTGERTYQPTTSNVPATAQAYMAPKVTANGDSKPRWGGTDRCPRCGKAVYAAEKMMGAGSAWHKSCFNCASCNKKLDSSNMTDKEGEIFCKACYGKHFGPKGFGYGIGAGTLANTT